MQVTSLPVKTIPDVQIHLTGEEALLLRLVIGRVTGDPDHPIRQVVDPLWEALSKVPNMPSGTEESNPLLSEMLDGNLMVVPDWNPNWQKGWDR